MRYRVTGYSAALLEMHVCITGTKSPKQSVKARNLGGNPEEEAAISKVRGEYTEGKRRGSPARRGRPPVSALLRQKLRSVSER